MSGGGALLRTTVVALVAVAVGVGGGCSQGGTGPDAGPVSIWPSDPRAPLVPGALPEGFQVEGADMGAVVGRNGSRALLIGEPDRETDPGSGPLIVAGSSSGSSMAGPFGGEPVSDLGVADSTFGPYIADDGPWTWIVFNASSDCIEDCGYYVVGRGVSDEDLIAVARGTDYEDEGPVVDPRALPDGMAPLVTAPPADGIQTNRGADIYLESADGPGRISIEQVEAPAELAVLWGFWIDDADGTRIRDRQGWAGRVGATSEHADHGRVWVEDGTVVAVLGWHVDGEVLDEVVDGLRPGTPDDLRALGDEVVAREPTGEAMCGSTVLSGLVEDSRWVVGFDAGRGGGGGNPDAIDVCTELIRPSGPTGGTVGGSTLAPVGSITVEASGVGGGPIEGTYVYGAAPPGTVAVELALADGTTIALQLSDAGPREHGERWFATFTPAPVDGATVIARAADGSELARAPAVG